VTALDCITTNDLNFLEWAKQVSTEHSDILKQMLKSSDVLDRVIAKRIMQNGGGV
jgi:hypothetical protein